MKISHRPPKGFTLIELLVVITIIGVLASLAMPALNGALIKVNQTKVLNDAKQIYVGLKLFAADFDGSFPKKAPTASDIEGGALATDANGAFRNLIPRYISNEKPFYVEKSPWCTQKPAEAADTDLTANLPAGVNHFAYVRGLNETSNGAYPLVADGFSTTVGTYTDQEGAVGSLWKGQNAIVVRVDGSAKVERCNSAFQVTAVLQSGGTPANIFVHNAAANWLPAAGGEFLVVNPATGGGTAD